MTLIDGKKIANDIKQEVKLEVEDINKKYNVVPKMVIFLVGNNPSSEIYVRNKVKLSQEINTITEIIKLPTETTEDALIDVYKKLRPGDPASAQGGRQILESRLDNVLFRAGLGITRKQTRQIVNHGHITVNGQKVDIPSYLVKVGDVISVKDKSKSSARIKEIVETNSARVTPKWLEINRETLTGKVLALAERSDIDYEVEEHLIVELYSK